MQKRTTTRAQFRTRDEGGEKRIEGYFATFQGSYTPWPGYEETVDPHAFDGQLEGDVRCLIDHDTRLVLGRTTAGTLELRVDEKGLWGSVLINENDTDAMNLYARVQRGDVNQCSFGFDINEEEDEYRNDGSVHVTLKRVTLYEVSCVTFPAYEDTAIQARRREVDAMKARQLEAWRRGLLDRVRGAVSVSAP